MDGYCAGLDFGTSNSSIGTVEGGRAFLVGSSSSRSPRRSPTSGTCVPRSTCSWSISAAAEPERVRRVVDVVRERRGHALASAVEAAKIRLSERCRSVIELTLADGPLRAPTDRATFEEAVSEEMTRIGAVIDETLKRARMRPDDVDRVFPSGGSSSVPILNATVGARMPGVAIVRGGTFGSVGLGLVLAARRRFG